MPHEPSPTERAELLRATIRSLLVQAGRETPAATAIRRDLYLAEQAAQQDGEEDTDA